MVANISVTDDKYPLAFEQFDFNFLAIQNIIDKNLDEILGMSEVKQLSEVKPLIRSLNDKIQDLKGFDIDLLEEGSASLLLLSKIVNEREKETIRAVYNIFTLRNWLNLS